MGNLTEDMKCVLRMICRYLFTFKRVRRHYETVLIQAHSNCNLTPKILSATNFNIYQ